ncbi:MAG: hypothetical protein G8D91_00375 [gamma proteobacterium symbiont of Clathrolucina costata]
MIKSRTVNAIIDELYDEIVGEIVLEFARCKDMDQVKAKCCAYSIDPDELLPEVTQSK